MKKFGLIAALAVTLVSSPAWAASPHDGSWESVEAKSSWSDGNFPKGFKLTINVKFTADQLEYHSVNTTRADKPFKTDYVTSLDGKPHEFHEQARFNQIAVRKLNANEYEILKMKDGDVIVGEFWTFSPDGKTLVRRGVGKSPEGRSKAYEEFFVRK
ncbi:MAG: hypothetical protein V4514_17325 [Pseudomonadota bacterium]|uniref:hypothetical protein n=1 Tax=unclassified Phenylobacterium TaxID=2640670 RepID=UPI0006F4222C|nr:MULTISPECIES: hypothetical protein [unclassified Phenylobacterium]KRB41304.1 hypothetical protein ASE02_05935 [Phenylobacterium sp. Root700]MBT9472921.1 hypothetical protein [Phenylobacterium sp.]